MSCRDISASITQVPNVTHETWSLLPQQYPNNEPLKLQVSGGDTLLNMTALPDTYSRGGSEVELSRQYLRAMPESKGGPIPDSRPALQLAVDRRIFNGTWIACKGVSSRSALRSVEVPLNDGSGVFWYERECVYSVRNGATSHVEVL